MIDINDEFRQLVTALASHQIDYALCGGMAMAVHQRPRMTIDIDILIQPNSLNDVLLVARELKIDMSAQASTTRLKRVAQLRRLGLSLQRAKIKNDSNTDKGKPRETNLSRDDKAENA